MAITSGFFNSVNGDRLYNAEEISHYFDGLVSDGVFQTIGNKLAVTQNSGMSVKVGTGRAFIKSHWLKNDDPYVLSIDTADTQFNRIDRVVIRLDLTESERNVSIVVKTGVASYSAVAPALTRTNTIYELCLAQIYVHANTTTIKQSNIVDYRPNSSMCGWVTGVIKQVDTADLFLQWQSAYEDYYTQMTTAFDIWFSDLTEQLQVDTTIKKYQNTVVIRTATTNIPIGIPEYAPNDILFVHARNKLLVENQEYSVSGSGENAFIRTLGFAIEANQSVTFIVLKSEAGINRGTINSIIGINNRIDNIIANSSETENNSELIDIRTDTNGTVYSSAGNAVRSQIGNINENITELQTQTSILSSNVTQNTNDIATLQTTTANLTVSVNNAINWTEKASTNYPCGWRTGYYDTNNEGAIHSSYKYMSSTGFWNFPDGYTVTVTPPNGYEVRYLIFNSNNEYTDVCSDYSDNLIFTASSDNYYRFTVRGFNNDSNTKYNDSNFVNSITGSVSKISLKEKVTDIEARLNNPLKKNVKILAIGNSWCRDSVRWLWTILNEAGYNAKIVQPYMGGANLYDMYFGINDESYTYTHSTWQQKTHDTYQTWTYTSDNPVYNPSNSDYANGRNGVGLTLQEIVDSDTWDYVLILGNRRQTARNTQYADSTIANTYTVDGNEITETWNMNDFIAKIKSWCENTPKVFYMTAWSIAENTTGQHWTDAINTYYNTEWVQAEQDRTAFYELINENITKALKYGMYHMGNNIDGFVDLAKALYYARQDTYLSQFGFEMQRAGTNSHLSEGLPMYLCSFTIANCLFGIQPNDIFTMPNFSSGSNADTDTGDTAVSNIQASKGLLYLAKKCAEKANYNPFG